MGGGGTWGVGGWRGWGDVMGLREGNLGSDGQGLELHVRIACGRDGGRGRRARRAKMDGGWGGTRKQLEGTGDPGDRGADCWRGLGTAMATRRASREGGKARRGKCGERGAGPRLPPQHPRPTRRTPILQLAGYGEMDAVGRR